MELEETGFPSPEAQENQDNEFVSESQKRALWFKAMLDTPGWQLIDAFLKAEEQHLLVKLVNSRDTIETQRLQALVLAIQLLPSIFNAVVTDAEAARVIIDEFTNNQQTH